jgi:hypothetical protein
MVRISTKHGARVDEELAHEVESLQRGAPVEARSESYRQQEGAADGEREPSARTAPADQLGPDEVSARTELSRHLRLRVFPATRDELLKEAGENTAPPAVVEALAGLPPDLSFGTVHEVWQALGGNVDSVEGRARR